MARASYSATPLLRSLVHRPQVEPFSGVEIHMEMDMEGKWSGNGVQFVKIVWIGLDLGQSVDFKSYL